MQIERNGAIYMISYKKLWKMLIDKDLKKKDLANLAEISQYTVNKITRGDTVTTETLAKICQALDCNVGDIMDIIPTKEQTKG